MAESAVPSTDASSPTLKSVQILRAIAAIGVLTYHAAVTKHDFLGGEPAPFRDLLLGAAGVDLFFVISGFVMVYSSHALFGHADGPWRFFRRRLVRIAPLYWSMTIALIVYIGAAHGEELWALYSPASLVASFLFWPYPRLDGNAFPLHRLGWTLNYEMFFYEVFAVATLLRRRAAVATICVAFLALAALGQAVTLPLPFRFWSSPIIMEFCYGMVVALIYREGFRLPPAAAWVLGLVACAGYAAAATPDNEWRVLFWGLPSAALVASCVLSTSVWQPGALGRFFVLLGDASYSLYLVHPLVFPLVRRTIGPWFVGTNAGWAYGVISWLAAIAASVVCYLLFERPITRALRRRLRVSPAPSAP